MRNCFIKSYELRTSDFDCEKRLLPSAVLDLFQQAAAEHAELLGVGRNAMLEKNLIWVVTKIKYKTEAPAKMYDRVQVKTWPSEPEALTFLRNYTVSDSDGNLIIKGLSEWVLIHSERRRIVRASNIYKDIEYFIQEKTFPEGFGRISDFQTDSKPYTVSPVFTDIDMNGHVNNAKYADYIMNAMPVKKDKTISEYRIDYHREAEIGKELNIFISEDTNKISAKALDAENKKMFSAEIYLQDSINI